MDFFEQQRRAKRRTGWLMGSMIKSAISREEEIFLAASAMLGDSPDLKL